MLESLVKAGAMDSFGKRAAMMAALDTAIERRAEGAEGSGVRAAWACSASSTAMWRRRRRSRAKACRCAGVG